MKALTSEQAKGTMTFHLPLNRGPETPPEMTLVVRRVMENRYHVGLAVCSVGDQFVKRIGRKIAYDRLRGRPFMGDTPDQILAQIFKHIAQLECNRPNTLSAATQADLLLLAGTLGKMRVA